MPDKLIVIDGQNVYLHDETQVKLIEPDGTGSDFTCDATFLRAVTIGRWFVFTKDRKIFGIVQGIWNTK